MKTTMMAAAIGALAGSALAQPGQNYVSGFAHSPLGGASIGPAAERRLPVHNLGSSGQDGVQVNWLTASGGTVTIDPGSITPGSSIMTSRKGWDGMVKTRNGIEVTGTGLVMHGDYTGIGAVAVHVRVMGSGGVLTSDTIEPAAFTRNLTGVVSGGCPGGGQPHWYKRWAFVGGANSEGNFEIWVFGCEVPDLYHDLVANSVEVTPILAVGSAEDVGFSTVTVTGSGMSGFEVSDAAISTFGMPVWGVGQGHISEQCSDPTCGEKKLVVSNIGSTGQDGVAIDLGANAGGVQFSMRKDYCCPGHVTLMKAVEDSGSESRLACTTLSVNPDGSAQVELSADFSDYGASGFVLTCYAAPGVVVGPPAGVEFIDGGAKPVFTNRCPDGTTEKWINVGEVKNPVWQFDGCEGGGATGMMAFPSGMVLGGVSSFTLTPRAATSHTSGRIRHVVITKNGTEMELRSVAVLPPPSSCGTSDYDGDGDYGTDFDIQAFFACLGGNCCTSCNPNGSDFNGDGDYGTDLDIQDFFSILGGGPCL